MKRAALLLFLFLTAPILVSAQGGLQEVQVLSDPENDVEQSPVAPPPTDSEPDASTDLVGLYIRERTEHMDFRIQVKDIQPEGGLPIASDGRIEIDFILGDTTVSYGTEEDPDEDRVTVPRDRFRLELEHQGGAATARLLHYDIARDEYIVVFQTCGTPACETKVTALVDEASWVVAIPRVHLQDADGATPSPGLRLHSFRAVSSNDIDSISFGVVQWSDAMPDDGEPAGEFVPVLGVSPQTGHLRLSSPYPVRWSNGEETTYIYDVYLNNTADEEDEVTLSVSDIPPGWEVRLPGTSIHINAGQRTLLPIVLATPFSHQHGAFESFVVETHSLLDPEAVGRVELGIRYAAIPHPTGHHSRVWIHAAEPFQQPVYDVQLPTDRMRTNSHFMSALAPKDQPGSIDAFIAPDTDQWDFTRYQFTWYISLEPGMRNGLDFNLTQTGRLDLPFVIEGGGTDAVIFGSLYLRHPSLSPVVEGMALANFYSNAKTDIQADKETIVSAVLHPTPRSDYVPHRPAGGHVYLELNLRVDSKPEYRTGLERYSPLLVPGGTIDLPLDEYHDSLDRSYRPLNDITFEVQGPSKQFVNHGESVLFTFLLNNSGIANEQFDLAATSLGADWVTFLDGTTIAVPSNGQEEVRVLVSTDDEAWEGQIVGPVIEAISRNDPLARASERVYVEVDGSRDHEDMSHLLEVDDPDASGRFLPTIGWAPALAVCAILQGIIRTRRL